MLHKYICFKFGFPENCKHYLFSGTTVIKNNEQKITQCPVITEGCTLLFIPLKELNIASPIDSSGKHMHIPPTISPGGYGGVRPSNEYNFEGTINIQKAVTIYKRPLFSDLSSIYLPKGMFSSYLDLCKDIVSPSSVTIHNPDKMTLKGGGHAKIQKYFFA